MHIRDTFDEYAARETDSDMEEIRALPDNFQVPDWFRWEPGFTFRDEDGDLCILLGLGGYRDTEIVPGLYIPGMGLLVKLLFEKPGIMVAYQYKGEWYLRVFYTEDKEHFFGTIQPL